MGEVPGSVVSGEVEEVCGDSNDGDADVGCSL